MSKLIRKATVQVVAVRNRIRSHHQEMWWVQNLVLNRPEGQIIKDRSIDKLRRYQFCQWYWRNLEKRFPIYYYYIKYHLDISSHQLRLWLHFWYSPSRRERSFSEPHSLLLTCRNTQHTHGEHASGDDGGENKTFRSGIMFHYRGKHEQSVKKSIKCVSSSLPVIAPGLLCMLAARRLHSVP